MVVTWWDYGHFTTFVAERRVLADGASQRTHVPHRVTRALLASSDAETLGLLRMLPCGSDAAGEPEEARGAMGKLRAAGLEAIEAHDLVVALAVLSRADAEARLRDRGLDPARTADEARTLWQHAHAIDAAKLDDFIAPRWNVTPARCRDVRGAWRCPTRLRLDDGVRIEAVDVIPSVPARTRVALRQPPGERRETREIAMPVMVLVADGTRLQEVPVVPLAGMTSLRDLGVLIDVPKRRVLVGPPATLSSTIADLLHLDGRYARAFAKLDEHVSPGRERVVTWQIDWAYAGNRMRRAGDPSLPSKRPQCARVLRRRGRGSRAATRCWARRSNSDRPSPTSILRSGGVVTGRLAMAGSLTRRGGCQRFRPVFGTGWGRLGGSPLAGGAMAAFRLTRSHRMADNRTPTETA
jgi:hypothetical protein